RIPVEHPPPWPLDPILVPAVPAAADARLQHHLGERRGAKVVGPRPPAIEAGGENGPGLFGRSPHGEALADRRWRDGPAQDVRSWSSVFSGSGFSTSALKASR